MKKTRSILLALSLILAVSAGSASASTIYLSGISSTTYYDAEKTRAQDDDDQMCWAAVAANMLSWSGWGEPYSGSEDEIFTYFQNHWTNKGGNMHYGIEWWFDGTNNYQGDTNFSTWSQVKEPGGGFLTGYTFDDYYKFSSNDDSALQTIYDYITTGYVVGLSLTKSNASGHAITCWGVELDEQSNITGIWVTDSDDYAKQLALYSVLYSNSDNRYYLQSYHGSNSYAITEVQGLLAAVPLPGAILFPAAGLIWITGIRRKQKY